MAIFKVVKKFITISLITLYLLGATEAYQLLKLPYLVEHYKTHKQFNKEMVLFEDLKGNCMSC